MTRNINRRNLLAGGAALLGSSALLSSLSGTARAQDVRNLRVSGFVESQEQLRQMVAALEAYTKANPSVAITPEFSGFSAFVDKLAVEAAGGNAPDMFTVNATIAGEYSTRGVLTELDQFVPDPLDLADYLPPTLESVTINGKLYAVPNDVITLATVIDTAVFEEIGLPLPSAEWTWEDLAKTAITIGEKKGRGFWGMEDSGNSWIFFDMFLRGRGKDILTPERQWGFETSDLVAYWQYWKDLRDAGGVPPGDIQALSNEDDPTTYGIVGGRTAMILSLTDAYIGVQSLVERPLVIHNAPNRFDGGEIKQNHPMATGNAMAIWSKTPDARAVVDLISYLHFDPEGSRIFYKDSGVVPASSRARAELAANGSDAEKRVVAYIENLVKGGYAKTRQRSVSGLSGAMRRKNQGIAFGELTVEQAAEELLVEMTPNLK